MKSIIKKIESLNEMLKAYKATNDEIGQLSDQWCETHNAFRTKYGDISISEMSDEQRAEYNIGLDLNRQIVVKDKERAAIEKKFIKGVRTLAKELDIIEPSDTLYGCSTELNVIASSVKKALDSICSRLTVNYEEVSLF